MQGVELGSGQSQVCIQTGRRTSWELPCGESPGDPDECKAGHGKTKQTHTIKN